MGVVTYLPADETSRRARAAIAYSLREAADIEGEVEPVISPATFKRIIRKKNPRPAKREEREAIADACGVPRRFMEEGFEALLNDATVQEQLNELRATHSGLASALAMLRSELSARVSRLERRANEGS